MLVAFDFDGTLSDSEMMVLLGEEQGVAEEIADITERAMNDEIDYATSLRERAALLADGGRAFLEIAPDRAEAVGGLLGRAGLAAAVRHSDLSGRVRCLETGRCSAKK